MRERRMGREQGYKVHERVYGQVNICRRRVEVGKGHERLCDMEEWGTGSLFDEFLQ